MSKINPSHYKQGVEDLRKAQWYMDKLIDVADDVELPTKMEGSQ